MTPEEFAPEKFARGEGGGEFAPACGTMAARARKRPTAPSLITALARFHLGPEIAYHA